MQITYYSINIKNARIKNYLSLIKDDLSEYIFDYHFSSEDEAINALVKWIVKNEYFLNYSLNLEDGWFYIVDAPGAIVVDRNTVSYKIPLVKGNVDDNIFDELYNINYLSNLGAYWREDDKGLICNFSFCIRKEFFNINWYEWYSKKGENK